MTQKLRIKRRKGIGKSIKSSFIEKSKKAFSLSKEEKKSLTKYRTKFKEAPKKIQRVASGFQFGGLLGVESRRLGIEKPTIKPKLLKKKRKKRKKYITIRIKR